MTVEPFSERRKEGLRLVSFDPHMGGSGEQADLWVPILPGTDAAVALAMAYVLVHEENLIDVDFLTNRTNGPALVDLETKRIIRAEGSNKALYMDLSDNAVKPYDECEKPALEGTFESMERRARLVSPCIKSTLRPTRRSMRKAFRPFPPRRFARLRKSMAKQLISERLLPSMA